MKALRIVQIVVLAGVAVYLVLVHNANPTNVTLPLAIPLPPAVLIAVALVIGWLVGWLPGRVRAWRRGREIDRLERKIDELESHLPGYDRDGTPVIPDRDERAAGGDGATGVAARLLRRGRRPEPSEADRKA